MEGDKVSDLIPRDKTFTNAIIAKRSTPYHKHKMIGDFEIVYSTKPIYKGLLCRKFSLIDPNDIKEVYCEPDVRLYMESINKGIPTLMSMLYSSGGDHYLYGINEAKSEEDKKLKDWLVIDNTFSNSIKFGGRNTIFLLIAPNVIGKEGMNKYLGRYNSFEYNDETLNLLKEVQPIEELLEGN